MSANIGERKFKKNQMSVTGYLLTVVKYLVPLSVYMIHDMLMYVGSKKSIYARYHVKYIIKYDHGFTAIKIGK